MGAWGRPASSGGAARALLKFANQRVGLLHLFEPPRRLRRAAVVIRVMQLHLAPVCDADLGVGRRMGDTEHLVGIHHRHRLLHRSRRARARCQPVATRSYRPGGPIRCGRFGIAGTGGRLAQTAGPVAVPVLGDGVVGTVPVVGGIGAVCVPGGTVLVPGEVAVPVELPEPDLPGLSPGRLGALSQCVILPLVMMKFTRAVVPVPPQPWVAPPGPERSVSLNSASMYGPRFVARDVLGAAWQQPVDEHRRRDAVEPGFVPRAVEEHARGCGSSRRPPARARSAAPSTSP